MRSDDEIKQDLDGVWKSYKALKDSGIKVTVLGAEPHPLDEARDEPLALRLAVGAR